MESIILYISRFIGSLVIKKTDRSVFDGAQYDDNAREIQFIRPEERAGHNLILYFFDGKTAFSPITLGVGNSFVVPNTLTQSTILEMQIAFETGGVYSERSNIFTLKFRPSIKGDGPVAEWPPEGWYMPDPDQPGVPGPPGPAGRDGDPGPAGKDGADGIPALLIKAPSREDAIAWSALPENVNNIYIWE